MLKSNIEMVLKEWLCLNWIHRVVVNDTVMKHQVLKDREFLD